MKKKAYQASVSFTDETQENMTVHAKIQQRCTIVGLNLQSDL